MLRAFLREEGRVDRLEPLIDLCVKRTQRIISWLRRRQRTGLHTIGLSIEDIAFDVAANLFVAQYNSPHPPLFEHLQRFADTDERLMAEFETLLASNVFQSLTRLYAEGNRTRYLMLRRIREYARSREDIETLDTLAGRLYHPAGEENALLGLPAMPEEELRVLLHASGAATRGTVRTLFDMAVELLFTQRQFRRVLPEFVLLQVATELWELHYLVDREDDGEEQRERIELAHRLIVQAVDILHERFERQANRNERLGAAEIEAFEQAALSYYLSMLDGQRLSHFTALRNAMPGLTQERYRASYRNQLEFYMRKVLEKTRELALDQRTDINF